MGQNGLSEGARRFWHSLNRLKRADAEAIAGPGLEDEARIAAAKLLGLEPLRWHNIRRRRRASIDYGAAAAELRAAGLIDYGGPPAPTDFRRACPQCGASVLWLATRTGLEAPWCRKCGALRFWLVFHGQAPIGFGGFGGASLW